MSFRTQTSLDGSWDFQIDPDGRRDIDQVDEWRTIQVPAPWQAQFDDLRQYSGAAWYRRRFQVEQLPDGVAILHFGAADYHATVWVNGQKAGEHEGGYLPFEFDVTSLLVAGKNELAVYIVDPDDDRARWPDYPFSEISHGKQSWYGSIGGLWQSVSLDFRPVQHIQSVRITPNVAERTVSVEAALSGEKPVRMHVAVLAPEGYTLAVAAFDGSPDEATGLIDMPGSELSLWSPETPTLYTVVASLLDGEDAIDQVRIPFGFRAVEARDGRIYLNGEPIYLRSALDQGYYPETIYTVPSVAFLEDQLQKAKALGLNCLRIHIKVEDPRYYEVADRLGMLIWTEIPGWALLTPAADARAKQTFREIVARDWNHPSIFAWTLINENWGTDLARNPEHRRWLAEFYDEAKRIDPTRLVVDNSACNSNFHVAGDLEDYHQYNAIPDHAAEWDAWVADFAGRADWVWAEDYADRRRADMPIILSEYGNWGLPNPDGLKEQGQDPWWFENGHEWGDGIVYPHGMERRFHFWGLDKYFGTLDEFTAQHQHHMSRSLAYETGTVRLHPSIGGYVITEFTDVHWECNGLLDMQRNVKRNLDEFVALNQDYVVVVRPQRWSGRPGESLAVEVRGFGVDGPLEAGVLHWSAGDSSGQLEAPGGVVEVALPAGAPDGLLTVEATWTDAEGNVRAAGGAEIAYTTPQAPAAGVRVVDDPALADMMAGLGYNVVDGDSDALLVARRYTEELMTAVQGGAKLLLLAGPESQEIPLPVGDVIPRAGTHWEGDWATSFSWMKKSGPFAGLPGDPLLEMEYADIMPDAVLVGLPAWVMRTHCWAWLALGWIHKPVALLADMPYGHGNVVISTFNLTPETLADNAVAQSLLAGMVELAS